MRSRPQPSSSVLKAVIDACLWAYLIESYRAVSTDRCSSAIMRLCQRFYTVLMVCAMS